jgi:sucrose-6-phosphate hydrolase SacC (GH32 family)
MKKITVSIVSAISILLISESSLAASASLDMRIKNQELRIQKGRDKGQITKEEERILQDEQKNIKRMLNKFSSKHDISPKNEKEIHVALDRSSVHIFKKRYNDQTMLNGRLIKKVTP